jgi:hypothetical protein
MGIAGILTRSGPMAATAARTLVLIPSPADGHRWQPGVLAHRATAIERPPDRL